MKLCPCGNEVKVKYCRKCRLIKGGQPKKVWIVTMGDKVEVINTKHPLYMKRVHIIERCKNPKLADKKYYGHLKVADEWVKNPQSFYEWALHNGWSKELTIDRIDPKQGYNADNCRWITMFENISRAHKSRRYTTIDDYKPMIDMIKAGYLFVDISKALNICVKTVRKAARLVGIQPRFFVKASDRYKKSEELFLQGKTVSEVSVALNTMYDTIRYDWLKFRKKYVCSSTKTKKQRH
jgi:hypothetical protein